MTGVPTGLLLSLGIALPPALAAQGGADCFPDKNSNEARTMAIFGVPLTFGGVGAPVRGARGGIEVGFEVTYLPTVDPATATPTVCRPGKGPEHTDLLPVAPRPRVRIFLPAGFSLEASWVPPLRMSQTKANLFGIAMARAMQLDRRGSVLSVRGHAAFGTIEAPITCNDQALMDATSVCFQGTRSNDAFKPNIFGIEAAVGWSLGRRIRPYLGTGYNHLAPRFRVNFTDQFGEVDRRRVAVNLSRAVFFAGATWSASPALSLTAEIYSAPADATTARVAARYRLGRSSRPSAAPAPHANPAPARGASPDR